MADLLFIVSRTEPRQYFYLKHVYADGMWFSTVAWANGAGARGRRRPSDATSSGATAT
jgi:hypothetical protein